MPNLPPPHWPAWVRRLGRLLVTRLGLHRVAPGGVPPSAAAPAVVSPDADAPASGVAASPVVEPSVAGGGRFVAMTGEPAGEGALDYHLYLPGVAAQGPVPLLVMLHGCTQTPEDFALGTRMNELAEAAGVIVAYPAQSARANPQRCWNWFDPANQARGAGEPEAVAAMVRALLRRHRIDPQRVYVAGLSAGGAAAMVLGEAYPDLLAAVAVHSGLACGLARDLPTALAAMREPQAALMAGHRPRLPVIVFHGDQDRTVHPRNGELILAQAAPDWPASRDEAGQQPGGHRWRRTCRLDASGHVRCEHWLVEGLGHAWSGGSPKGTFTDPLGPDASREILRFLLAQARAPG